MEGVQIEQLGNAANMGEPMILSTSDRVQDCGEVEETQTIHGSVNGQLEIEIPSGESRQGAIHTIQLQSPGGNTHIVEGLVVSNATATSGSDGVDGTTETTLFQTASGTFLLPTSHATCNSLTNSLINSSVSPEGGGQCEVITADPTDHHILSGLQVVRVTTGENCETIFLVPSHGGGKDGMQPVMVLQSAEDITDEQVQSHQAEVVEEAIELNIPSPKPVLTTVKQEVDGQERTIVVGSDGEVRHFDNSVNNDVNTLVIVAGDRSNNGGLSRTPFVNTSTTSSEITTTEKKPVISTVNGHASKTVGTTPPSTIGIASAGNDDRPKRKAAIKAVATRKAALASLTSPRKQSNSTPKTPKNKGKTAQQSATTPEAPKPMNVAKKTTSVQIIPTTPLRMSNAPSPFIPITQTTTQPPPPPVVSTVPQPRVILAGGTPIQATPRSYFLLPEDIVSESDEEGEVTPIRKCIVCLRRRRFTEPIFDANQEHGGNLNTASKKQLLQSVETLIAHLDISTNLPATVKQNDVGICTACLDSLQKWHIFTSAISKRHETVKSSGAPFDDTPVNWEPFETRIYRNFRKMAKVKEVYYSATHSQLTRRQLTEKDWDFFCEHLFRFNSLKSERARELERYMMCREKLTHLYCIKCQRLVKNGRKGFVKHMKTQHPHDTVLLPCDICGNHYPDKDAPPTSENYYPHWISHFYFNSCEDCGKRFPTKRALGQHKQTVHKNKTAQWNSKPGTVVGSPSEDRPWKCDQCDASFKMKGALVSHRDVVHFNRKNHVCSICGEAFKSASSLRGHVRRHEGRRDYKCEVCHKEYYTYSALKGHKVVHQTARDFICGICGKAFKKKKALEEHGTLHTGVKPHRCPICGREIRVKSNLYKHMKIHKKNAELGITSGRGRHSINNASTVAVGSSSSSLPIPVSLLPPPPPPVVIQSSTITKPSPSRTITTGSGGKTKTKNEPKLKLIKVEQQRPIISIKEESPEYSSSFSQSSSSIANPTSALKMTTTTSPIQGATAVDVVLENAELAGGDHRGPIVVSIVTDGLGGGPANILHMNQDQQAQLLNVVTSLANSQGQSITMTGAGGATFLASPLHAVSTGAGTTNRATLVTTSSAGGGGNERGEEQILTVPPTTQYFTTQQFFNSLDHLQN